MLVNLKNSALALAFKTFLNEQFRDYGTVLDCEVDTARSLIRLHAMLRGEKEPVMATLEGYAVERDAGGAYIRLRRLSSSRDWLARLLNVLFAGKRYPLPAPLAALL